MIVTRFAPSPSGRLHLGHAYSAAIGHGRAREDGGKFILRIEDLDQTRCRPELIEGIYEDLRWLGLNWDQPVLVQSERTFAYEAALDRLKARGLAYACFCTRADIAQSLTAPHGDAAAKRGQTHLEGGNHGHYPSSWYNKAKKPVRPPTQTGSHADAIGSISSALLKSSVTLDRT